MGDLESELPSFTLLSEIRPLHLECILHLKVILVQQGAYILFSLGGNFLSIVMNKVEIFSMVEIAVGQLGKVGKCFLFSACGL